MLPFTAKVNIYVCKGNEDSSTNSFVVGGGDRDSLGPRSSRCSPNQTGTNLEKLVS